MGQSTSSWNFNQPSLTDGDYTAPDGTEYRVINGKKYELVQYREPPILPNWNGESTPNAPAPSSPERSTPVQMISDYRTAIQMTDNFGRALGHVPVPTYDSLLDQHNGQSLNAMQGIVTISFPKNITITPADDSAIETVTSLDYEDYSGVGSLSAPSTSPIMSGGAIDDEMQNSIWMIMARQDNNHLIYASQNQQELELRNQPTYHPLPGLPESYSNQTNIIPRANGAGGGASSGNIGQFYGQYGETSPCLFRYLSQRIYQTY